MTRILCLDDDLDMLTLLSLTLRQAGYEVIGTANGYEALALLRTQSIDLLIEDILWSGIRGETICQMIRGDESLRNIPVLIVSAYIAGGERMVAEGSADAFVDYRLGMIALLDAVEDVLRKRSIPLAPEEARARARNRWRRHGEVKS